MRIMNKIPTLCISISKNPSNFGYIVHNAGYKELNLNYFYLPFKIDNLQSAIQSIKTLGIRGCGVSMPFKEAIIPLLDELDPISKKIKSVNTIVNNNGKLKGYNTDVVGAYHSLKKICNNSDDKVLILGSGGVVRSILEALKKIQIKKIFLSSRNSKSAHILKNEFKIDLIPWEERNEFDGDLLINATPIGMNIIDSTPITENNIQNFKKIMDVVVTAKNTKLIEIALKNNSEITDGKTMSLYQAAEQFRLYTGMEPPIDIMKRALVDYYGEM
tara:strand:- start:578 stop:1396 length:819 start_codon:yes stop_codon:yes gene_type:complete